MTLYKTTITPVWTYGTQLWGTVSNFNIEILQRFQSKTLRSPIDTTWYVTIEANTSRLQDTHSQRRNNKM